MVLCPISSSSDWGAWVLILSSWLHQVLCHCHLQCCPGLCSALSIWCNRASALVFLPWVLACAFIWLGVRCMRAQSIATKRKQHLHLYVALLRVVMCLTSSLMMLLQVLDADRCLMQTGACLFFSSWYVLSTVVTTFAQTICFKAYHKTVCWSTVGDHFVGDIVLLFLFLLPVCFDSFTMMPLALANLQTAELMHCH